ncbi:hypothetical protein C1645_748691 [Glomus cerebriforme]|uniref:Uncharacterized protein n=1 Tax=Glomus cerebriforme TaxID=658196 RepID=A0A397TUR1_9GLOM|nr:hypothetical protein C1645_748691 [Glomus cerebriforme]
MQNFNEQSQRTIYPSSSYNPQLNSTLNISSNMNTVQVVTLDNTSQVSTLNPFTAPFNTSENQPSQGVSASSHILQPLQGYQEPHLSSLVHPQETVVMSKYSFFYTPCNDFQMYHIICEEIPLSFESVSQLLNNTDNISIYQCNNIYTFYHEQPEIKKIFQVTCEMVSHTTIFQFLNKIIYGIQSIQNENQWHEFSKNHQENLKFHLKKDLIYYLTSRLVREQNYNPSKNFIQDNCNKNMITYTLPFGQSFTSQQDNIYQLGEFQNDIRDNYQGYYDTNSFQP